MDFKAPGREAIVSTGMAEPLANYRPGGIYFRKAFREAPTREARDELFLALLREWVREQGIIPPKFEMTQAEVVDKPWLFTALADGQMELDPPQEESPRRAELFWFPQPLAQV